MTLKCCWASKKQKTQQPLSGWVSWDILVESGELNPRPQAVHRQFYMCSQLILSFNLGLCQLTGLSLAIH